MKLDDFIKCGHFAYILGASLCTDRVLKWKIFMRLSLTAIIVTFFFAHVSATGIAQQVTFSKKNTSLKEVFDQIAKQTGYNILYQSSKLEDSEKLDANFKMESLESVLNQVLAKQNLAYTFKNKTIVIKPQTTSLPANTRIIQDEIIIRGKVVDEQGKGMSGATVVLKGHKRIARTDTKGSFIIKVPNANQILEISYLGYLKQEVKAKADLIIKLEPQTSNLEDVEVTVGYFAKKRESFTGSELTLNGDEIRQVGMGNILQTLSALDPAIHMKESLEFGSDPNRIPDLTIRGENGFDLRGTADDGKSNPNAPLFILDGVDVSAERIYDLDLNRIDNVTILKDAAATALYGSRGANGVILIRTVRPKPGEIRTTFNSNFIVSTPDLRDYNLMNASEKLHYEKLAGKWTDKLGNYEGQMLLDMQYNEINKEILRGVDTYWLSKPLRTSINQRYNLYLEGGDKSFRYGINLRKENDRGVMIGSGRGKTGIGVVFNYDIGNNFLMRNDLVVEEVKGDNSPYGSFSNFTNQNPYDRIYDGNGDYILMLSNGNYNPMINASLPQKDYNKYISIQDNFSVDWRIIPSLRMQGRISLSKQLDKNEFYRSPNSSEYATETVPEKKGKYTTLNSESVDIDGNLTIAYNKVIHKNVFNIGIGTNLLTHSKEGEGFTATGFLNDDMTFVEFAAQYQENSKPKGVFDKSTMVGFFGNANYGYDNRYFLDASYRTDGSSKFGRDSRFAPFWALGFAWNVHNEEFWKSAESTLKVRGSAGSTGSLNFSSSQALTTYSYGQNSGYNGNLGAILMGFGNSSLKWQNTLSYNVGVDLGLFQNFMQLNLDGYMKLTENLLLPIDVAPSTGFSSYIENMGQMKNIGIDFRLRFNLIRDRAKDLNWNITFAAINNRNRIQKLSNALEAMNAEANKLANTTSSSPLRTYEVGRSQSALMVVRSAGIDPATGNEVFIKRSGEYTFDYDYKDKVVVGDTKPTVEGNFTSNLTYKGWNLFTLFQYRVGGKIFNSTLKSKVEGANPLYNADRRVLYDRWIEPGNTAKYKRIDDTSDSYQTTRFVQEYNSFTLGALSLTYDVQSVWKTKLRAERIKIMFSTTDLFRISTVKAERGTAYPFAQTYTAGINVTF
ncbi:SusC/RagA family TonB-linked outer membrane protein [Sphingobacterium luzhongxinii]|uniref:SusC/RagA family TonB-linked outer membrane protein n=1 Tax=Sphingobacterium luzhongxinii TaxID=2654181 RepID=UPI0013DC9CF3|nr:SusC/RagA family TonB-linked outer membrane protein [Sphingobacterium sp. xlx-73]